MGALGSASITTTFAPFASSVAGKRGSPSGPRIPRNKEVMMSLLLPYATTGLSLIAGWGLSVGACCRFALSQPCMPYSCLLQKEEGMVRLPVLCPHCHGDQVIKG